MANFERLRTKTQSNFFTLARLFDSFKRIDT